MIRQTAAKAMLAVATSLASLVTAMAQPSQGGILERFEFTAETSKQWRLPDRLNEISGLALTDDARLLAVTDEEAIIYELDYSAGKLVKAFALGHPTVRGDFEGIATSEGRVWLTTSKGVIYEFREGRDGERVHFDTYPTGVGKACEIEGLAWRQVDQALLLLCKEIKKNSGLASLAIFAWSTGRRALLDEQTIYLPDRDIAAALRMTRLNPSGLVIHRNSGHLLIVAARQRAIVELDAEGALVAARVLPLAGRHRQAEGIEILPSGEILIADEGGGHRARLAVYSPGLKSSGGSP